VVSNLRLTFRGGTVRNAGFLIPCLMTVSLAAAGADDYKVSQLQQDVRDLQRQVQALTRQIESQRLQPAPLPGNVVNPGAANALPPAAGVPVWVDAGKWQRLAPGMSELEVVSVLGPPTSMRTSDAERVLLYALEIGSSGYLGGSVTLRERVVVGIQKPVLR
jgi:hypothetical protein